MVQLSKREGCVRDHLQQIAASEEAVVLSVGRPFLGSHADEAVTAGADDSRDEGMFP
jgi:DNA-binding FrmR family transcriptional regulator